jgi:predicted RNA-binding Zn ribbon-like protein
MTGEGRHKPALLEAAAALREVHRTLVQAVRAAYEREVGPAGGPGQLLRLLTEHPYFAWLHPMSELIVDLDSLLTQEILPAGTVAGVRQEIDRLTQASDSPFWQKYAPLLQQDTDVVMAHGRLRRAINALPEVADGLHQRKEWVAPRVHAKRKSRS